MRATAEPEEGNKVRLSVEIDEAEMDEALDEVMRRLSREVRVPGFRPGKVPRRVIEARMGGAAALRGEALREALPDLLRPGGHRHRGRSHRPAGDRHHLG